MWGSGSLVLLLCFFCLAVAYESRLHKRELVRERERERTRLDDLMAGLYFFCVFLEIVFLLLFELLGLWFGILFCW